MDKLFFGKGMISVIICTHNPRPQFLLSVLKALKSQTLAHDNWELLIIDNASEEAVSSRFDLSWHPRGKHCRENELGLVHARRKGFLAARGDTIVFVDDDNVLAADYLEEAARLFAQNPGLGCVSGDIKADYESTPPRWFTPEFESWLAVRKITRDHIANFWHPKAEPVGAGMVVRRSVLAKINELHGVSDAGPVLDRCGDGLLGGQDVEIAYAALDLGYSIGQVARLRMTHLIPSHRVSERYLFKLYRSLCASGRLISAKRAKATRVSHIWRESAKDLLRVFFNKRLGRRLAYERLKSVRMADAILRGEIRSKNSG
jgi:glycosyltransferase involved in cell wall biosynthesis